MSQLFTNIYNKLFSLRPKPCPNIVLPLRSSKKELLLENRGGSLKICLLSKSDGLSFKL